MDSRERRKLPSGSGSPESCHQRILVHIVDVEVKHFRLLISCMSDTINYIDENSALYAWLCGSYWGSNTLIDTCMSNIGGPDPCDPCCGVNAYEQQNTRRRRRRRLTNAVASFCLLSPPNKVTANPVSGTCLSGPRGDVNTPSSVNSRPPTKLQQHHHHHHHHHLICSNNSW